MEAWKAAVLGMTVWLALACASPRRACAQMSIPGLGGGLPGGALGGGGLGGLPVGGSALGGSALGAPAAAAPRTIWSFFGLSKANLAACRTKLCASPLGQMANSMAMPLSGMTGGLFPSICPTVPTDAQVAALAAASGPNSAEAVAAKIKQDEADAKARRAAVRYLSTVDCHYWPEAEAALIVALRDDRNECVRYEAALAFLNGCCCTEKTVEALNIVVSGSEKDGKPSETSDRVKSTAFAALQRCMMTFHPSEPKPLEPAEPIPLERPGEAPPPPAPATDLSFNRPQVPLEGNFRRVAYYYQPPQRSVEQIIDEARATVARYRGQPPASRMLRTGERSVYHAFTHAKPTPAAVDSAHRAHESSTLAAAPPPPTVRDAARAAASPSAVSHTQGTRIPLPRSPRTPRPAVAEPDTVKPVSYAPETGDSSGPPTGQRNLRDIVLRSFRAH